MYVPLHVSRRTNMHYVSDTDRELFFRWSNVCMRFAAQLEIQLIYIIIRDTKC